MLFFLTEGGQRESARSMQDYAQEGECSVKLFGLELWGLRPWVWKWEVHGINNLMLCTQTQGLIEGCANFLKIWCHNTYFFRQLMSSNRQKNRLASYQIFPDTLVSLSSPLSLFLYLSDQNNLTCLTIKLSWKLKFAYWLRCQVWLLVLKMNVPVQHVSSSPTSQQFSNLIDTLKVFNNANIKQVTFLQS